MQRFGGAGLVVLGVVLVVYGLNASDSLRSRLSGLFTGSPADQSIWLFLGGALSVFGGISLAWFCRRQRGYPQD